ncbi:MAG: GAF domain-containing protein [Candidatus Aminicenantes bacterium]|nr:GAF domain-containing protein [Candidatus Aminicenantes bacterium]
MKEFNLLIEKLKNDVQKGASEENLKKVVNRIAGFYVDKMQLNSDEVAIFLSNQEKNILSFAYPEYLINSGMIPVSSTDAVAAHVFRTGRSIMENNFQQQKHLFIFELIKTPDNKIKPIWKVMSSIIATPDEKIGVIQTSRRGTDISEVGGDFTLQDLDFLEKTINDLAPLIKLVLPENFRGKIR